MSNELEDMVEAIVPHIGSIFFRFILFYFISIMVIYEGAHLSEISSIIEGNPHSLVDSGYPYLFNLTKLKLLAHPLRTLVYY
jgi:uncharacterized membrane protein YcaP (DUF421 family)